MLLSLKLWTPRIRDLSHDILNLMGTVIDPARTYFFASTTDAQFSILELLNFDGVAVDAYAQLPLEESYCGIIHENHLPYLVIPDTRADSRTMALSITEEAHVGSYLGVPIYLPDHSMFGTLCAIDPQAILYSEKQRDNIRILARIMERALEAEYVARHDALTGVFNRLYWDELRGDGDREAQVVLLDIDNFKEINDTHGHEAGNLVIQRFAGTLKALFPGGDVIRLGGDEFCIVHWEQDEMNMERQYRQMLHQVRDLEGMDFSASAGVSSWGHDLSLLLRQADASMYEAKRRGKAQWVAWEGWV